MSKKPEWKIRTLESIPPRLVLGAYRDIIGAINGAETVFSNQEILKELGGVGDSAELDPVALDVYRCVKILPAVVDSLVEAGLLSRRSDGRLKKSEDFEDFWDLTKKVRTSVEKAIRWGAYYTLAKERDKRYFSFDELISALTPSSQEIVHILERIAVFREGKWRRILQKDHDMWKIKERPGQMRMPPSTVKDVSAKILHALSVFFESGASEIDTSKVIGKIRSVDAENIEKFLLRLHFTKKENRWSLPPEIAKTPQKLIEEIEMPGRLPALQADFECLRLLDSAHLSATEIVGLTGIEKSTISRALKRLSHEDLIGLTVKKGPFGEQYNTTLCDNCWLSKDKEECRDETIGDIKRMLKNRRWKPVDVDWNAFSNQALNKLSQTLAGFEVEKPIKQDIKESTKLWEALLEPQVGKIIDALETRAVRMVNEQGLIDEERIYELIDEQCKTLPMLYSLGIRHTLRSKRIRQGLEMYSTGKAKSRADSSNQKALRGFKRGH